MAWHGEMKMKMNKAGESNRKLAEDGENKS